MVMLQFKSALLLYTVLSIFHLLYCRTCGNTKNIILAITIIPVSGGNDPKVSQSPIRHIFTAIERDNMRAEMKDKQITTLND